MLHDIAECVERRRGLRVPVDTWVNRYVDGEPFLCRAEDISLGGILLHRLIEPEVPEQEEVGLEFELPDSGDLVTATGVAMRRPDDPRKVAVRFCYLSPQNASRIARYLASRGITGALDS
jgi:c-di-GMP-binding flagellar brake protein YcgR